MRTIPSVLTVGTLLAGGLIGPALAHDADHSNADPYLRGARWMFSELNAGKLLCNRWPDAASQTVDFLAFSAFAPDLQPIDDDDMNKLSSYQMLGEPDLTTGVGTILYNYNDNLAKSSCMKIDSGWVGAVPNRGPLPTIPGSEVVAKIRQECSTDDRLVRLGISQLVNASGVSWLYAARFKSAGGACYESTLLVETGEVNCAVFGASCNPRLKPPKAGDPWPPIEQKN